MRKLNNAGHNRDIEVSEELWLCAKEDLKASESSLGIPSLLQINEPIFRDRKRTSSVELKDYHKRDNFDSDFVAELEHFNPEHHPILHSIIDVPIWTLKNRLLNKSPQRMDN